jgi:hypothetical protein
VSECAPGMKERMEKNMRCTVFCRLLSFEGLSEQKKEERGLKQLLQRRQSIEKSTCQIARLLINFPQRFAFIAHGMFLFEHVIAQQVFDLLSFRHSTKLINKSLISCIGQAYWNTACLSFRLSSMYKICKIFLQYCHIDIQKCLEVFSCNPS